MQKFCGWWFCGNGSTIWFVLKIRWLLRITDARHSSNFWQTVTCRAWGVCEKWYENWFRELAKCNETLPWLYLLSLQCIFLFALTWSVGGSVNLDGRNMIDALIRELMEVWSNVPDVFYLVLFCCGCIMSSQSVHVILVRIMAWCQTDNKPLSKLLRMNIWAPVY